MAKPAKKIERKDEKARKAKQLPVPKGYKLLIALPEIEEATKGGIIKASQTMKLEEVGSICGFVITTAKKEIGLLCVLIQAQDLKCMEKNFV
jgi:hypothetical protein